MYKMSGSQLVLRNHENFFKTILTSKVNVFIMY